MKSCVFISLFLITTSAWSQRLVGSASGFVSSDEVNVSWSVGEPFVGTVISAEVTVAVGFQQIFANVVIGIESEVIQELTVHPNPAKNEIWIKLGPSYQDVHVEIRSASSVLVLDKWFTTDGDNPIAIDINHFASGIYYILIKNKFSGTALRFVKL